MIQNIRRKGKRCMEYLPEALSIMGIGVTVVFLTLSLLIIALWALGRLIPKHIVSAGEEKVSLDQEETTVLGKTLESSKNIRAAMIAVALAGSSGSSCHATPYFNVVRWKCIARKHYIKVFRWSAGANQFRSTPPPKQ